MNKFTIDDLFSIYRKYKNKYEGEAYKYISQVLTDAKPLHKETFSKRRVDRASLTRGSCNEAHPTLANCPLWNIYQHKE